MDIRREQLIEFGVPAAVGVLAAYWTLAMYPTPARLLSDHGQGYQLAGAAEILRGRHPFIAFKDIYGPLPHYVSAAAQWIGGGRVGAECGLAAIAFGLGTAIFFRLMVKCGVAMKYAFPATLVAIAVQPLSWRYYLFLLPMLFLAAAWSYGEKPEPRRIVGMGFASTLAGLFRPDLGVFTFLVGLVMVGVGSGSSKRWRHLLIFTMAVVGGALPWLGWLAIHGRLGDYLVNSSLDAVADAAGRARAAPWPSLAHGWLSAENAKAWLFRLPLTMLVPGLGGLVLRWAETTTNVRTFLLGLATYAVLSQAQASHIVDWIHVRDTLPVRIFLLTWLTAIPARSWFHCWTCFRIAVAGIGITLVAAAAAKEPLAQVEPGRLAAKLRRYDATPRELLAAVRAANGNFRARLYEYLRDHSDPDETVLAVIEAPESNYFAERGLAGGQLAIFPGYFAGARDQRELIARLRGGKTAFVVIDHTGMDEYPEMSLARFAPEFHEFLEREFVPVVQIGYCRVLTPRGRVRRQ